MIVLDAKALCYRMYYADTKLRLVPRVAAWIRKTVAALGGDRLVTAWDGSGVCFRLDFLPDYKLGRKPTPGALRAQVGEVQGMCAAEGWRPISVDRYEADDVMATLAREATASDPVVVVSDDKDVLQCLRQHVKVRKFAGGETVTEFSFFSEWHVTPNGLPDVLGLMGDSVDGIPGVPGIGKKTACQLIGFAGSLDGVYAQVGGLPISGALKRKLIAHEAQARLSKRAATLFDGLDLREEVGA